MKIAFCASMVLALAASVAARPAGAKKAAAPGDAPARPNVVFFYADDLGTGDLGSYGAGDVRTPNLDRLAAQGARFTQFSVSHCVCSPTRASFLTGRYPSRSRVFGHFAALESNARRGMPDWLDPADAVLPQALQAAGYRTAVFGKWHLGGGSGRSFQGKPINSPDAPPVAAYGFDADRTYFGNGPTWRGTEPADAPHDVYPYEDEGVMTASSRLIADASIAFLDDHAKEHRERPFLLNVWFHVPHTPMKPTDAMREPFRHLPEPRQTFCAAVADMDAHVGRVLERLDALGMADDTLVLFSSDNGAPHNNGGSNGSLRLWKHQLYEGGVRAPLIARWPGRVPAGHVDETSVLNIVDLAPTIIRLAGATPPAGYMSDGIDVSDALSGEPFDREAPLFWHHPGSVKGSPKLAMRSGQWKLLTDADGGAAQLYDLTADPGETRDRAAERSDVTEPMCTQLLAWKATLPKPETASARAATPQ